jgi:type II secretory pathway pseudopilin PulG
VARATRAGERGFTLLETLLALTILMIVMGVVMTSMLQFSKTQSTVWNRANMHDAVRSATELLQQGVGQAGRVSLETGVGVTMTTAVTAAGSQTVTISPNTANMFVGERLVIDAGPTEETVTVTALTTTSITGEFTQLHNTGAPVVVLGGFATGVVPTTMTNGSTGSVLKIYGDINGDGNMVYVEYVCDTTNGFLYRNMMPFDAGSKPAVNPSQVLLTNVLPNPGGTPCFTYEQKSVNSTAYVLNVAISLTTRTQAVDRVTRQFQTETKALLNVAPRNVFDAWQLASLGASNRIQPMPASVLALLP